MPRSTTPTKLEFSGPYRVAGDQAALEKLPDNKPGIYIWCVQSADAYYRVHYVGEASNIRGRTYQHTRNQMNGESHAYSPEDLRQNTKVLVHRAHFGVVPKFKDEITAKQANHDYLKCQSVFFATLLEHEETRNRCQFETALVYAIEDWGRNILAVGSPHKREGRPQRFEIDTGNFDIEGLTGQVLNVHIPEQR